MNQTVANAVMEAIRANKPREGIVQMLCITEKQFLKMEYVVGEKTSAVLDSDQRVVVI